jgi:hypothetical protein
MMNNKNYQTFLRGGIPEGTEYRVYDKVEDRYIEGPIKGGKSSSSWVLQMWNGYKDKRNIYQDKSEFKDRFVLQKLVDGRWEDD